MEALAVFAIDDLYVFSYYHRNNVIKWCRYITVVVMLPIIVSIVSRCIGCIIQLVLYVCIRYSAELALFRGVLAICICWVLNVYQWLSVRNVFCIPENISLCSIQVIILFWNFQKWTHLCLKFSFLIIFISIVLS